MRDAVGHAGIAAAVLGALLAPCEVARSEEPPAAEAAAGVVADVLARARERETALDGLEASWITVGMAVDGRRVHSLTAGEASWNWPAEKWVTRLTFVEGGLPEGVLDVDSRAPPEALWRSVREGAPMSIGVFDGGSTLRLGPHGASLEWSGRIVDGLQSGIRRSPLGPAVLAGQQYWSEFLPSSRVVATGASRLDAGDRLILLAPTESGADVVTVWIVSVRPSWKYLPARLVLAQVAAGAVDALAAAVAAGERDHPVAEVKMEWHVTEAAEIAGVWLPVRATSNHAAFMRTGPAWSWVKWTPRPSPASIPSVRPLTLPGEVSRGTVVVADGMTHEISWFRDGVRAAAGMPAPFQPAMPVGSPAGGSRAWWILAAGLGLAALAAVGYMGRRRLRRRDPP